MGCLYQHPHHPRFRNNHRAGGGKKVRARVWEEFYKIMSFGHVMIVALMNLLQPLLPAHAIYTIKPARSVNMTTGSTNNSLITKKEKMKQGGRNIMCVWG